MMYKYLTLDDNSEIVHSEMKEDGSVVVYIEKPDADECFHHMTCFLPSCRIEEVSGFSETEVERYLEIIRSSSNTIMEFSNHQLL